MNSITPYEIKIAEKLEQLPVPDMADSIWASIELQLNADISSDSTDDKTSQEPARGKPGIGKGFYFSIIAAIIIIAVLIYKNNKKTKRTNDKALPPKTEIIMPVTDSNRTVTDPVKNNNEVKNTTNKKDSASIPFIPGKRMSFDSLTQPNFPLNKIDSQTVLKDKPFLPPFDSAFTRPPLRKPRGVKGISDSSYKIIMQKDSAKRGG